MSNLVCLLPSRSASTTCTMLSLPGRCCLIMAAPVSEVCPVAELVMAAYTEATPYKSN